MGERGAKLTDLLCGVLGEMVEGVEGGVEIVEAGERVRWLFNAMVPSVTWLI